MYFKDVIGQEVLKKQLIQTAQQGVVPHARLLCGEEGTGAFQLAFAYARYLNCTDRSDTDACARCASCVKYDAMAHPDLHFVFPIVANREKKKRVCDDYIESWRAMLKVHRYFDIEMWLQAMEAENKQAVIYTEESDQIQRKVNMRIYEAEFRILLLWKPERMHASCANKLLKIIEEPPENTVLLLVSDQPSRILGTILSRTQRLNVGPIAEEPLSHLLESQYQLNTTEVAQITHLAQGNLLRAIDLVGKSEEKQFFFQQFVRMMRNSWSRNVKEMKLFSEEMVNIGRERQKEFLVYCQYLVRESFVSRFQEGELNYMNLEENSFSEKFAPFVNERNIVDFMNELSEAERHIAQNGNARMIFFDLSLRITALLKR